MSLSKISEKMFYQEQFILTSLPALNAAVTDNLGFTRKQVIATVSGGFQTQETLIALRLALGLIQDDDRPVLVLSVRSQDEYTEQLCQLLETDPGQLASGLEPDRSQERLVVKNPRSWEDFESESRQLLESLRPSLILIESPDLTIPCASGWSYVLRHASEPDPWGGMARKVKALADTGHCPVWVFGELCYGQKYRQQAGEKPMPPGEADWRTCAQLEAYIDYWDCVIEVGWNPSAGILISSLKNRLGGHFSQVPLLARDF